MMLPNIIDTTVSVSSPRTLARTLKRIPRALIERNKYASFQKVIRYVYRYSKFYKSRFDALKINPYKVRVPSDLGDFYTTPQDIWEHAEDLLCRKPGIAFESSGTTGRNKRVYFSRDELRSIGKLNAMGFYLWGMGPEDRIVNAFDFSFWIPGLITQKGIEDSGIFGMAAGKVDPSEVYKRISTYKFNVVLGEPTWLIKLTEMAEKKGSFPLKLIIGGAEEMPAAARSWMEKIWQGAKVRMVYASVESGGVLAAELGDHCHGYHLDENDFFVETAETDKDGYGDVTFTTLRRRTMPLIRYRNHDIGKIIEERCACGIPYRRLTKLRGRSDEMVVASGGNLYPLMFAEILKDVAGISHDWQIVFKLRGIKEIMEFNLEKREGASEEAVKKAIMGNMALKYPDLWKNLSLGIFETEFLYHPVGSLRTKTKLLRMVDKRHTQKA